MGEKRENMQFRILYFIAIIMIVAGHAGHGSIPLFNQWFPPLGFHLAIFVFCSGYFFINNKDKKIIEFIKKIIKKFLVPLYIWNLIYGIIIFILHKFGIQFGMDLSLKSLFILPIYDGHQFVLNLSSWFIWPLFIIELINIFIIKFIAKNDKYMYIYIVITILLGFLGVQLAIDGHNKNLWLLLVRVLYFLPFFSIGILYKIKIEKKDKCNNCLYFGVLFLLCLVAIYIFGGIKDYTISLSNDYDNFYRPFIVGILGIAFWLRISKILVPSLKNSKVVMIVSKNTYSIMMHHLMGFFLLNTFFYILSNIFKSIDGFNSKLFLSNIFYRFLPNNISNFNLIYVLVGILFSLFIASITGKIKSRVFKKG